MKNMKAWKEAILSNNERKAMPIMTYPGLNLINKKLHEIVTSGEAQYVCILSTSNPIQKSIHNRCKKTEKMLILSVAKPATLSMMANSVLRCLRKNIKLRTRFAKLATTNKPRKIKTMRVTKVFIQRI